MVLSHRGHRINLLNLYLTVTSLTFSRLAGPLKLSLVDMTLSLEETLPLLAAVPRLEGCFSSDIFSVINTSFQVCSGSHLAQSLPVRTCCPHPHTKVTSKISQETTNIHRSRLNYFSKHWLGASASLTWLLVPALRRHGWYGNPTRYGGAFD